MKALKWLLVAVGLLVLICAGFLGTVFAGTRDAAHTADAFLDAARRHDESAGQALLHSGFKMELDISLPEYWRITGLDRSTSAHWTSRHMDGSGKAVGGEAVTPTGSIPLRMRIVKENGRNRIAAIQSHFAGAAQPLPDPAAARKLFLDDVRLMIDVMEGKDVAPLYARCSTPFRKKNRAAVLAAALGIPEGEKAPEWEKLKSTLDAAPPSVDRDQQGQMILSTSVPADPQPWRWRLTYTWEDDRWYLQDLFASND